MGLVATKIKIKEIALDFRVMYLFIRSLHSINPLFCSESMLPPSHRPGLVLSYFRERREESGGSAPGRRRPVRLVRQEAWSRGA